MSLGKDIQKLEQVLEEQVLNVLLLLGAREVPESWQPVVSTASEAGRDRPESPASRTAH